MSITHKHVTMWHSRIIHGIDEHMNRRAYIEMLCTSSNLTVMKTVYNNDNILIVLHGTLPGCITFLENI